jgi:hypothetical protein
MPHQGLRNAVFTGDHSHQSVWLRNWYRCHDCDLTWHDDWFSACEDVCPRCEEWVETHNSVVLADNNAATSADESATQDENRAYTVLLMVPDYAARQYGEDVETVMVDASTPARAVAAAQASVASAREIEEPKDLGTIALFAGHHEPMNAVDR